MKSFCRSLSAGVLVVALMVPVVELEAGCLFGRARSVAGRSVAAAGKVAGRALSAGRSVAKRARSFAARGARAAVGRGRCN